MPITYSRGDQPIWTLRDRNGDPLSNGWLWSYRDTHRDEFKAIYTEPTGNIAWDNPIKADLAGTLQNLYFSNDEPYYFVISKERNGLIPVDVIDTVEHYSPGDGGGAAPVTTAIDIKNFIVNGQFTDHYPDKSGVQLFPTEQELTIAEGGWSFRKNNGSATDTLSFIDFPLGIITPKGNPTVYLEYDCTAVAAGETYKEIVWKVPNVRVFATEDITISWAAKSTLSSNLKVKIRQFFGTGGAPSAVVDTDIHDANLTTSWVGLNETIVVPAVSGNTLGTNNDDYFAIVFQLPKNAVSNVGLVNIQLEKGDSASSYEIESRDEQNERRTGALLPPITDKDAGKVLAVDRFYNPYSSTPILGWQGGFTPIGFIGMWGTNDANYLPPGWFWCDGTFRYKYEYPLLFRSLFNVVSGGALWGIVPSHSFIGGTPFTNPMTLQTYNTATVGEPTIPAPTIATMPAGFNIVISIPGNPTTQQTCLMTQVAGSLFNGGEYFTISSYVASDPNAQYYVWYRVDGVGIDPAVGGKVGIRCDISKVDTAIDTAEKTRDVLENAQFILPDMRDLFVRGSGLTTNPGHPESEDIQAHNHLMRVRNDIPNNDSPAGRYLSKSELINPPPSGLVDIYHSAHDGNTLAGDAITDTGGTETRPANVRVAFIIKHD